jgi:hypothetical protein
MVGMGSRSSFEWWYFQKDRSNFEFSFFQSNFANNSLTRSINYCGSDTIIFTVLVLEILRLKAFSVNNGSSVLPLSWPFSRYFRPKIFIGKTYSLNE